MNLNGKVKYLLLHYAAGEAAKAPELSLHRFFCSFSLLLYNTSLTSSSTNISPVALQQLTHQFIQYNSSFTSSSTIAHQLPYYSSLTSSSSTMAHWLAKKALLLVAHYKSSLNCLPQLTDIHTINHSLAPLQQLTSLPETIQKLHELSISSNS